MTDFSDTSPLIVCFETDTGAVAALMDDPVLLSREMVEQDGSNFYLSAKLRGIDHLRQSITDGPSFVALIAAASVTACDECNAYPAEPCMSADGTRTVPIHAARVASIRAAIKEITDHYMAEGVKLDGEPEEVKTSES